MTTVTVDVRCDAKDCTAFTTALHTHEVAAEALALQRASDTGWKVGAQHWCPKHGRGK